MSDKFDLCIIGGGPAGFAGAIRALDLGKHVCIVEADEIGGTGVMWGALSSKTMWELAKDYDIAAKVDRGYRSAGLIVDYAAVRNTVIQAVKEKQYQMLSQLETYSPMRWKGPGSITFKRGRGTFLSRECIEVTNEDGRQEEIKADFSLICTGSKPRDFPHVTVDQKRILNSDGILNLKEFPKRLVIIGAGIVGCEYATIFSNFDQTKVFLVDHQERIIPFEDEDVSRFVSTNLKKNNVDIFHSAILRSINTRPDHLEVILDFDDGHSEVVEADAALISIGRTPNLAGLNLDRIGLTTDDIGFLTCDENCLVKDNIYAAGDCTDAYHVVTGEKTWIPLALRANRAGWAVADNICGKDAKLSGVAGTAVFKVFDLEVARTGLAVDEAKKFGFEPVKVTIKTRSRAHAHPGASVIHVQMVGDKKTGRLLGAQMVGKEGVAHRINAVAVALHNQMTVKDYSQTDLAYAPPFGPTWDPTLTAANQLLKKI